MDDGLIHEPREIVLRLCDEEGMVSNETARWPAESQGLPEEMYIERCNRLKEAFTADEPETIYDGAPFECTGSMTFPEVTITCDNPIHQPMGDVAEMSPSESG